jgi:hypothetical protein
MLDEVEMILDPPESKKKKKPIASSAHSAD